MVSRLNALSMSVGVFLLAHSALGQTLTNFQMLYGFTSTNTTTFPYAAVVEGSDGFLYGTTYGGSSGSDLGGIFKIDKNGNNFKLLHQFMRSDGDTPSAPLIEATNGVLYGTTWLDGSGASGSVFKINKDASGFAVLHQFTGATNDGASSVSGLLQASDGLLYGTAQFGGTAPLGGDGVVFSMDLAGSNFTVLHSFTGNDGIAPQCSLIEGTNGALYGTALAGGSNNLGTVFHIDKDGNNFAVVHYFSGGVTDGYGPYANLCKGPNGLLYGTTTAGGAHDSGVIFSMGYDGSSFTVLHHFGNIPNDGAQGYSDVVLGPDGLLYGTTFTGGANGYGTIYAISGDGSVYSVVLDFANTNGANPNPLILGADGTLYGTANSGAASVLGNVFKMSGSVLADHNVLNPPQNLGGPWRISGNGVANRTYTIQFTPGFGPMAWQTLGTATADSSGTWHFDDGTNSTMRYFRATYP